MSYEFKQTAKTTGSGQHKDYPLNLKQAETFCSNVQKSLLNGMHVKICDGENISKAVLRIGFTPPREAKLGNSATPISLHQPNPTFCNQMQCVFNVYKKVVKDFWDKQPKMRQGLILEPVGSLNMA